MVVAAVLALAALGCTDGNEDAAAPTSSTLPAPETVLRIGVERWPSCLNPLTCADRTLRQQILQHVLPVAFEIDDDGNHTPSALLATEPSLVDEDGAFVIRYEIAEQATWADGRPVTSSDFKGTWQAIMATPEADRTGYERIVDVDDRDPTVAVVTLDGPLLDWQALFGGASGYLLQADAFGASTDLTGRFEDDLPFAAGPYQLVSWAEDEAVLAATEPWENQLAPSADQVRIERVDLDETDDLMSYDVLVPASSTATAPDGFDTRRLPTTSVLGLWFDQRTPLLAPLEHRQAIDTLFDRGALVDVAGDGANVRCPGWLPSVGPWCDAATVARPEPDPALAEFILFQLGWLTDESGTLARNGETFVVPVSHDPAIPTSAEVAEEVVRQLGELDIGATLTEVTASDWRARRDADAATGVGVFAVDVGRSPRVDGLYGCSDGPASTPWGVCPPALVDQAGLVGASKPDDALMHVAEIGRLVAAEKLWIPLVQLRSQSFHRPGRVVPPATSSPVGGALHHLERFDVDS